MRFQGFEVLYTETCYMRRQKFGAPAGQLSEPKLELHL